MAKDLDIQWLLEQAKDEETRKWIFQVNEWRNYIIKHNQFIEDKTDFFLCLGRYKLFFNAASSFSTIEVYQEIFKENNHFIATGFTGEDAGIVFDIGANQGFYTLKLK